MPLQPAILGSTRLNNFRLGYESAALAAVRETRVTILIAGVFANPRVRIAGLTIRDVLNDAPNTCSLTVDTTAPVPGQDLRISLNSDTPRLLFHGTFQTVDLSYEGRPSQLAWTCQAVDDGTRANRKRPFGTWTNVSATTIAQYLIATFAPGFTAAGVQAGLPAISITFDGSDTLTSALTRITTLIGGYFYFDDLDLHLFLTEATDAPDDLDTTPGRFLNDPPIHAQADDSQIRTRVYGKGHGEPLSADVAAGDTVLPVDNVVMFNPLGGQAIAGTTPDGAQSQILDYTGIELGGAGSLIGPSAAPSVAPSLALALGTGIESGAHDYAVVWVTAVGKTLPSPISTITHATVAAPVTTPLASNATRPYSVVDEWLVGAWAPGDTVDVAYSYSFGSTIGSASMQSTSASVVAVAAPDAWFHSPGASAKGVVIRMYYSANPQVKYLWVWHRVNGGAWRGWGSFGFTNYPSNTYTDVELTSPSIYSSVLSPPGSNPAYNQTTLTGIAIGPSGTTAREIYRTPIGSAQLKLQQTIANNTATTGVTDATADASLGANAPTGDDSGLSTATGQINAGSTTLLTAGAGPFETTGGWVRIGQQLVRHTGVSGNTLTGIPVSGIGALVNTVNYGEHVDVAPALLGVTGNALAMQKGTAVHIWVQRDDLAAQAALIAVDAAQGRVSDGVIEHVISDGRFGEDRLIAQCDADLALFSRPLVTITYASRDPKTKSGKPIVVNLPSPPISETLTIQDVTIDQIDVSPGTPPRFTTTASSVRFSLEDMLRRLIAGQAA